MAPFRHPPPQSVPRPDDSEEIRKWFARRDQFAPLGDRDLWPPAPLTPFAYESIDSLAVSGDGKVAFIQVGRAAWLVDTQSLAARPLSARVPNPRVIILSDDGSQAVLVSGSTIYVWDLTEDGSEPQSMWQSQPLQQTKYLSMSRDGRTVAAAESSQQAEIRIFDLERRTLTYSFTADADEGMQLHPGGKHIICFGDDGIARIYGSGGQQVEIKRNAGGAISRDGAWLVTNDLDNDRSVSLYALDASGEEMKVGPVKKIPTLRRVKRWNARMRFSPNASRALVEADSGHTLLVPISAPGSALLTRKMDGVGAILADETRAFLGPSYHDDRYPREVVAVADWSDGTRYLGAIAGTRRADQALLVGTSPLGFFGSLEAEPCPVASELVKYYERPEMMPSILGGGSVSMSPDDELHAQEVADRADVWLPFLRHLTADIDHRDLMDLNKGITHLTRAIASRASKIDSDVVRFGASKLSWSALNTASSEIRAMSVVEQGRLFDEMLDGLRADEASRAAMPDAARPSPSASSGAALELRTPQALARKRHTRVVLAGSVSVMAGIAGYLYFLLS